MTDTTPPSPDWQTLLDHRHRVKGFNAAFNRLMGCHSDLYTAYRESWGLQRGALADRHTRLAEVRDRILVLREMLIELRAEAFGIEEDAPAVDIVVPDAEPAGAEEPPAVANAEVVAAAPGTADYPLSDPLSGEENDLPAQTGGAAGDEPSLYPASQGEPDAPGDDGLPQPGTPDGDPERAPTDAESGT